MIQIRVITIAITFFFAACVNLLAQTEKYRVDNPSVAARLLSKGGQVVADYGSFKIISTEAANVASESNQVSSAEEFNFIELNTGQLDTRTTATKQLRKSRGNFHGKGLHLVQFAGPVKPEWRAALELTGVKIVSYIPQNAYLVYGDATALATAQAWAATNPVVQWEGAYNDGWKIHPSARATNALGQARWPGTDTFAIQLVEDPSANSNTLAQIDALKLAPVEREYSLLGYRNIFVQLPPERLPELATNADVVSIQLYSPRKKFCERQDQIMAGNLSGNLPSGPGYLAWLASKGFTQSQFDASGFVVDVSDSGIDNGTTSPGHFAFYKQGNPAGGSRVVYNRVEGTANSGSTKSGCDGHGNLNSHIIGGYTAMAAGFPHTDAGGYQYGLGVCPFVKVGSSVIFDPNTFTSPNYANLQSKAYNDGARVSNNSWGATNNTYDTDCQSYDALVRDAQPTGSTFATAGNQQMVIVFAAGNAGPGVNTVGSPGTAKNVIVVGAAENVRSHSLANGGKDASGNDGCTTPDTVADSAADISDFSSRGPCSDGRMKPDLVAPGTHVTGGVGQSILTTNGNGTAISCFTGEGVCGLAGGGTVSNANNYFPLGQQFYSTSSGTSHSTPAIAGACALLRQYFINASLTPPSPAMTKAFLMNSARYMTGTYANDTLPSKTQGMGSVNLGTAFDGVARVLRDQLSVDKFTATGQTRTNNGSVGDVSKPFRVTLAWTDAPGSTTGNAYNNNLDLTVTVGGNTYKGNVFSGANSITGGTADAKNNVESVFIPAGVSGPYVVTVAAANINSDGVPNEAPSLDQDYALVIYNTATNSFPIINGQPASQTNAVGASVTLNVAVSGDAPLSYKWFFNSVALATATNSSLSFANLDATNGGNYFVIITNVSGSATSSVATLTVTLAPIITQQPQAQSVAVGLPANFSVTALGAPALVYQWRLNSNNIAGANATNYPIASVSSGDAGYYDVVVTNLSGNVTSSVALLTVVNPAAYSGVLAGWDMAGLTGYGPTQLAASTNAPNVSVGNLTRGSGFTTTGTAAADAWGGNGLNTTSSAAAIAANDFATFSLGVSNGYSLSISNVSHFDYRRSSSGATNGLLQYSVNGGAFVDITNLYFASSSSSGASLAALDLSGIAALQNILPGTNVLFRIALSGATSTGGNWYIHSHATANVYDLEITGSLAPLVVATPPPVITSQPSPTNVFAGNNAAFSVTATGSAPLVYQWLKSGVPVANGGAISGALTNTLNFIPAATNHTGNYSVIVTNLGGSATSSVAALNVVPVPALLLSNSPNGLIIGADGGAVSNRFIVLMTTNLAAPAVWVPISTNVIGAGGQIRFTETNRAAPFQFYRIVFP